MIEGGVGLVEPSLLRSDVTSETASTLVLDDQAGKPAKPSKKSILHKIHNFHWGKTAAPTQGKSKNKTNTRPLTHTSSARSQLSILSSPQVKREVERQGQEAIALQASVPFLRRVPWAYTHKKELQSKIDAIGHNITNLESLLMPWPIEKTSYQQPLNEEARSSSKILLLAKGALTRLHEGLMRLNEEKTGQQPFRLSIQLREDVDMSRQELVREPNVHLRNESFVFNIQRQRKGNQNADSSLFFVESLIDVTSHEDRTLSDVLDETSMGAMHLTELHDLISTPDTARKRKPQTTEPVETWGYFRTPSNAKDHHVLFHDSSGQWSSPFDLADLLAGKQYRPMMSSTQIVQLARLILISHLYFSAVRHSLAVDPRPFHYRFFSRSDEDIETWDADEPHVLRPWLAFGFGSRAQRYRLGGGPGVAKAQNASLIELGLVLYQIGAGQTIEYGSGKSGLLKAKSNALKELNKVDNLAGMTLTDIVQACLSPEYLSSTGTKVGEEEETDIIINAISTLARYEQYLEGTISEAEGQVAPGENITVDPSVADAGNETSDQAHAHTIAGTSDPSKDSEAKPELIRKFNMKPHQMNARAANVATVIGDESQEGLAQPAVPKASSDQNHQHAMEDAVDNRILIRS